eukprot:CAMPEP_0170638888 /NCGR_PEP_ID=MMETSP0224-20130122/39322_1 /TAXON_ID=285029 /ORGANISM="Togula jolla, Strain CCCM 725" /LENGTH=1015 /DNA_ID=CAMNT_0010969139 /DNA_START=3 /DNA_END=3046 /DNA_ORIENTATION=+
MNTYRFSNLLGATYRGGSVEFTPDGNTLLSPVGNRVSAVDLVQGRCVTLGPENREDIKILALSPDAHLLLSIDRTGHALLVNFVRGAILTRINFKGLVQSARWSPDGKWLAVTKQRRLSIWRAPTLRLGWQFVQHRTFGGHHDDVLELAWAPNSLFLASCSRDMSVRLWSINPMESFEPIALVEHRSPVRGVFFSADMKYLYSMSRQGFLVSLRYDLKEDGQEEEHGSAPLYCRPGEWVIASKARCNQPHPQKVMKCAFDAGANLLAAGFDGGLFMLFEMPGMQALQTLSLGTEPLDVVTLGAGGDWLAVGSAALGQLLVWEWRSETYVLKQQGHHWGVQCVAFSPAGPPSLKREKTLSTMEARPEDRGSLAGRLLATGGYDGKVKLFNSQSGLCFVTFAEHTAPVTALCFTPQGNAVLSASKDGSVRAFDLLRYRNFRTFASPDGLCQFAGLAVDGGGEIVAASSLGGQYAIYVWSIQTGNVLEVLTAHTSYVQSLQFSPSTTHPGQLVTAGWDSAVRVWDLYLGANKGGAAETLQCPSSVLSVAFDPRGNDQCACSCLTGQILFWNVCEGRNLGSIDGLRDIQSGRQWHDRFASSHMKGIAPGQGLGKKKGSDGVNLNQHFSSISYARGGELLLCGSRNSPQVCLYDTSSYALTLRLTLTRNESLSGVKVMLNSKNMTEAGVSWQEFDLSESEVEDAETTRWQRRLRDDKVLPGVNVGEAKDMYSERELHVWNVAFSADSQQFAAATTHGVFVYSADIGLGTPSTAGHIYGSDMGRFAPQLLTRNVSAPAVLKALEAGDMSRAMILALALNDYGLLRQVYEAVPVKTVPVVVASIGSPLLPALLWFLSLEIRPVTGTPHFQFHVTWIEALIDLHFNTLLEMASGRARTGSALEAAAASRSDVAALCLQLLVELSQRHAAMVKTFSSNLYLLKYLSVAPHESAPGEETELRDPVATAVAEEIEGEIEAEIEEEIEEASAVLETKALKGTKLKRKRQRAALAESVDELKHPIDTA